MMDYERKRVERARMKKSVEATYKTGGIEESKNVLDVHVGSAGSADAIEMKLDVDINRTVSFVDASMVLVKYLEGVIKQGCRSTKTCVARDDA